MKFDVETNDLRRALIAVTPHADQGKDYPQLHRVRLEVGADNVTVTATNRYTVGHALVGLYDNGDGELGCVDLSPGDVKELLAVFKGRTGSDDDPGECLRFDVDDELLKVTDVSGLFAGKSLSLPRYPEPEEENFRSALWLLRARMSVTAGAAERLVTSGDMLGLFTRAAKVYGEPLVLDPSGDTGTLLITCGDRFIGLLMPVRQDEAEAARIRGWHDAWLERVDDALARADSMLPVGGDRS